MLRILHTADWHLGHTFFGYNRNNEHEYFLAWLLRTIEEKEIDALLIAGDVFDVSNPPATAQHLYYRFIHQAKSRFPHLQIVIIAGNHDSPARLEAPSPLLMEMQTIVKGSVRKKDGAIDYDDLIIPLKDRNESTECFCLTVPFFRQGDYPSVAGAQNSYSAGVSEFYRQLIETASAKCEGKPLLVVGHLQATGSEIAEKDYSERTIIGGLECIAPDVFTDAVAYVALGHIHKSQRVSGREHIRYAGSPLPLSFSEKFYRHGAVVVALESGKDAVIEKITYEPLVKLISVPSQGAASPEEVLHQLQQLPEAFLSELSADEHPYLEVRVELKEPDPMLTKQIVDLLADKAVRLTRITPIYAQQSASNSDELTEENSESLQNIDPAEMMRNVFEKKYAEQPSSELQDLFNEVYLDVTTKE